MKKLQYSVTITFVVLMTAIFACSIFKDNDGFSSFENRKLSERPKLTLTGIFSGRFEDAYESYLLDNFLLRDLSVGSYQMYTELFFIDAFKHDEDVLMSVDVDTFVTARKAEGSSGMQSGDSSGSGSTQQDAQSRSANTNRGADQIASGRQSGVEQQRSGGLQSAGSGPMTNSEQQPDSYQQEAGGMQEAEDGQNFDGPSSDLQNGGTSTYMAEAPGDEQQSSDGRVNNSLIISGDRIMMPAGTSNLKAFGGVLSEIAQILPGRNIYSVTGPTSASFYASSKYSTGYYDQSRAEGLIQSSAAGVKVVKGFEQLQSHKDENIYFRSDVHWTALGAYYAYKAFCSSAGLPPAILEDDFTMNTYKPFLGGLYSQIYKQPQAERLKNNPEQLDYYIPKTAYRLTLYKTGNLNSPYEADSIINTDFSSLGAYKYSCFAWGDQRIERIETDTPGDRAVLVVKDSYGSAFVPFLIPNYSKIYVIDPKGFNQEGSPSFDAKKLIGDESIDDVIFCFSIYGSGRKIIQDSLTSLFLR